MRSVAGIVGGAEASAFSTNCALLPASPTPLPLSGGPAVRSCDPENGSA
jgi:hypothetical protein